MKINADPEFPACGSWTDGASSENHPQNYFSLDDIVPGSLESISKPYSTVFESIVPVSRPEVAEMTKLYENYQRMAMIAYANEMADACIPHGVDPFEVSSAATKPFGYAPFAPSLGVGGHCIPINPYYLLSNSTFPLLQASRNGLWSSVGSSGCSCGDVVSLKMEML